MQQLTPDPHHQGCVSKHMESGETICVTPECPNYGTPVTISSRGSAGITMIDGSGNVSSLGVGRVRDLNME